MILSAYGHFLDKAGGICSLERFLMSGFHTQIYWHSPLYYRYDLLINYYFQLFGENNVLVLPFELLNIDGGKSLTNPIYQFVGIEKDESVGSKAIQNARDNKSYAIHRIFRWVNILSRPHPANGNAGWGWGRIREAFINYAKMFLTQTRVNSILKKDKEIIASFIKPYALESNRNLQKRIQFNLRDLGYTI